MCAQDPSAFQMAFNEKACRKSMSSRAIPFQGGRARKKGRRLCCHANSPAISLRQKQDVSA